jgi:hypothetical protein
MPYAEALRDVPQPPEQTALVKPDGRPTPEFWGYLKRMQSCLESFKAALDELEP